MTADNKSKMAWSIIHNVSGKDKNKNRTPLMFRSGKTFYQIDFAAEAF
jgi:arginine/ornithine N-succinyltransferase beta subunit